MTRSFYCAALFSCLLITSCSSSSKIVEAVESEPDKITRFTFLQMNDVYEISPLENGKVGGLARVANIRKRLLSENPSTYTVMAGDFVNPSLIATLKLDGERIKGRHMIDVLNIAGLDLAAFGNHEFDLKESELQQRIDESEFDWIGGNIFKASESGKVPFKKLGSDLPEYLILDMPDSDKKIGIFSACLAMNRVEYVHYDDVETSVESAIQALESQVDIVVGLTHLSIEDDLALAEKFPQIDLIMGGHEHHNMIHRSGNAVVAKADGNAKTVYVHRLSLNETTGELRIDSELVQVDETIQDEPATAKAISKWNAIAERSFAEMGFVPEEIVSEFSTPMDATESLLRFRPAPFGQLLARAMSAASKTAEAAILNSGSVRVDDTLEGNFTQYDVMRALPFGGALTEIEISGELLMKVLEVGWSNTGSGGYLQWDRIDREEDVFTINNEKIDPNRSYKIITTDFLLTGLESNLDFFKKDNPGISNVVEAVESDKDDLRNDIRSALIHYLKNGGI